MTTSSTTTQSTRGTIVELGKPWRGVGPFLFASRHVDKYPRGNAQGGPATGLSGRPLGNDFNHPSGWSMYHGDQVPGFPAHPHRGFETVTIVRHGVVDHADSTGAGARYGDGDVQWVTAGRGVIHSEMFPLLHQDAENPFELYQLWLNLPARNKDAAPEFTMQWHEEIPVVVSGGAKVTVIAGDFDGTAPLAPPNASWAADRDSDVAIWLIDLAAGASIELPDTNSDATERLLYVHGDAAASVSIDGSSVRDGQGFAQTARGRLTLSTAQAPATVLVLQGVPINEPVVAHGPFVMNTEAEIRQAFSDYRRDQFGGWPWPDNAPVYDLDTPRFAKFGDGRVEHPATEAPGVHAPGDVS
ncbi:pirin family protein [Mycobacterium sp. ACS4331]|uniref:pirin family protein n=1 Tax=Mycobacterium sp. ACS4331 TaxID=1834121 RepID=UPI0007FC0B75|nr:pirin family protein [Mycobacterium sp. ACS4331]OBF25026.1 pirin [Mycobacterium sp. ACS4331]